METYFLASSASCQCCYSLRGAVLRIRSISLNCTYSAPKIGANCLCVFSHPGVAIQLDKKKNSFCHLTGGTITMIVAQTWLVDSYVNIMGGTGPSYSCSYFPTNSWLTFNGTALIYLIQYGKFKFNISDILINKNWTMVSYTFTSAMWNYREVSVGSAGSSSTPPW